MHKVCERLVKIGKKARVQTVHSTHCAHTKCIHRINRQIGGTGLHRSPSLQKQSTHCISLACTQYTYLLNGQSEWFDNVRKVLKFSFIFSKADVIA